MSMDWFRWYHGTVIDPKLALIAKKSGQPRSVAIAIWAALLEQASQAESRGNISGFDVETIAVALDIDDDAIHSTITAMIAKGMIADQHITAWDKRQPQREDGAAERAKAWREKQKQSANATERNRTQPNAGKRPEEERDRDADADTDADTDKESPKQEAVGGIESVGAKPETDATAQPTAKPGKRSGKPLPNAPDWLPTETWQAFIDHRQAKHKPLTLQGANMTLRDLDKARRFGHDPNALLEMAIASGWTGCVFADKHFVPAITEIATTALTPHNGQSRPFATKQDRIAAQSEAALTTWLNNREPTAHVIEGECHEIH